MIVAVIDTSVNYTGRFQSLFEQAAVGKVFCPVISEELIIELEKQRIERAEKRFKVDQNEEIYSRQVNTAKFLTVNTRRTLEEYLIAKETYQEFEQNSQIGLRDPNDSFIEAMAIQAKKIYQKYSTDILIVTEDKDFDKTQEVKGIKVCSTVTFLHELYTDNPQNYKRLFKDFSNPFVDENSTQRDRIVDLLKPLESKKGSVAFQEPINKALELLGEPSLTDEDTLIKS